MPASDSSDGSLHGRRGRLTAVWRLLQRDRERRHTFMEIRSCNPLATGRKDR